MVAFEKISRQEWLERNPILRRYIATNPRGWHQVPGFTLWPDVSLLTSISDHQREQLALSLAGPIGILTGGPGTGKTYTVAKLIEFLLNTNAIALHDIVIGAPTGKAAVRLTEMLQANGLDIRAMTWHSILGIGSNSEAGGWSFRHNKTNPLSCRLMLGDESSMLDLSLMRSIFAARPAGCHMLWVGDVNQLPPVGNGAPLRDMIEAGLPCGELTEIKRNSGGIVEACKAIREQKSWSHFANKRDSNLTVTGDCQEYKLERIVELIRLHESDGRDPIWDCQVLVAVNESSPLSRKEVNKRLQDELNPGPKEKGTDFRPLDKIVCLKNGWYKSLRYSEEQNEKSEVYVANGELAEVKTIGNGQIIVELESPAREISIPLVAKKDDDDSNDDSEGEGKAKGAAANWDLGYALSVHKSQGSEWPVVIGVLDGASSAKMVCDRAWIYTVISRAREKMVLVGEQHLADRFCEHSKISRRKTFLTEQIKRQLLLREMDSL
jgi:exodeoxyribonuclease V alpha subunit